MCHNLFDITFHSRPRSRTRPTVRQGAGPKSFVRKETNTVIGRRPKIQQISAWELHESFPSFRGKEGKKAAPGDEKENERYDTSEQLTAIYRQPSFGIDLCTNFTTKYRCQFFRKNARPIIWMHITYCFPDFPVFLFLFPMFFLLYTMLLQLSR